MSPVSGSAESESPAQAVRRRERLSMDRASKVVKVCFRLFIAVLGEFVSIGTICFLCSFNKRFKQSVLRKVTESARINRFKTTSFEF